MSAWKAKKKDEDLAKNYYRDSQEKYLTRFKDIKVRIPDDGVSKETIEEQIKLLGTNKNNYILDLIENDIQTNPKGLKKEDFKIPRGVASKDTDN